MLALNQLIFTMGEIGGEEISMLIDMGSAVTLVHRHIWDKIKACYGSCVSSAETVIVPARHEMVIPAKVSASDKKA